MEGTACARNSRLVTGVGGVLGGRSARQDAAIDQLYGEGGLNLFFATADGAAKDNLNDLSSGELNIGL